MFYKKLLILLVSVFGVQSGFFNDSSLCDPFTIGTNIFNVIAARTYGALFPNSCPCTQPCTNADQFVKYYYTECDEQYYYELDPNNVTKDLHNEFQTKSITVIVHGYTDKVRFNGTGWMEPTGMKVSCDINGIAILVDYGEISSCNYNRTVAEIVPSVGYSIANALRKMEVPMKSVELVGHSLGAHITGYCGCSLNGEPKRIIALDAAGPGFDDRGLNSTCAQTVQALHTDGGDLGKLQSLGHIDFYANNHSYLQPGCSYKQCGHGKAIFYYFASLFYENQFNGVDCAQENTIATPATRFGIFSNDEHNGLYCFNTTACFPYVTDSNSTSDNEVTV